MTAKKTILLAVIIGISGIGIYALNEFSRRNPDVADLDAAFSVKANELLQEFQKNDSAASQKYLGKVISVEGLIKKIDHDGNGYYTVVLGDTAELSSVRCAIDSAHASDASNLHPISSVKIKGFLIGFNRDEMGLGSDVQLNRCLIEKRN